MAYSDTRQVFDPRAFVLTLGGTGLFLTVMVTLGAGVALNAINPEKMIAVNLDPPKPPPPIEPEVTKDKTVQSAPLNSPTPIIDLKPPSAPVLPSLPDPVIGTGGTGISPFGEPKVIDPPKKPPAAPVVVKASLDSRAAFQPTFPPGRIRAEQSGMVRVRVTIGTDGRVKSVEKISATHDDFFEATKKQALSKWRFKPATRDGVPYETSMTFSVTFNLDDL